MEHDFRRLHAHILAFCSETDAALAFSTLLHRSLLIPYLELFYGLILLCFCPSICLLSLSSLLLLVFMYIFVLKLFVIRSDALDFTVSPVDMMWCFNDICSSAEFVLSLVVQPTACVFSQIRPPVQIYRRWWFSISPAKHGSLADVLAQVCV